MKKIFNKYVVIGISCIGIFLFLLILLLTVDKKTNVEGQIGLYGFNKAFLVDRYKESWDGLSDVILYISLGFLLGLAIYGLYQLTNKKNLFKVDYDILLVGGGILIIILIWILFDAMLIVNYRPILIDMEASSSFPSTHVMLTTFILLSSGYCITKRESKKLIHTILGYGGFSVLVFICFLGRVLSSMHWMTDVLGGFLIGFGLFSLVVGLDKALISKERTIALETNHGNETC
ncbi:MAG: phosphatase PAP2 family protein [Anaeroplasmataceae bacterium]|nr:phosphatase PAP2 family protein [Anaeroplasmataceae bacterium]MDE6415285.1 phosphatase PAP2 family protein [Anaeroplasmataceae bacterium]